MAASAKPAMSMAEFASSVTDIGDSTPSVNLGIYGPPGCGKTAMLSALPDALLLAFDPGYVTAQRMKRKCRLSVINSHEKLMAGLDWLEDGAAEGYRWIIADGTSILQTRLLQQFGKEAWQANPEKRVSAYQPDKPDYFKSQNVLKSAVARLCDLPSNVVFTFHSMMGDDQDAETWYRPHIEGRNYQVGNFICGLLTSIGYYAAASRPGKPPVQIRRILWHQYRDEDKGVSYLAKDQLQVFPMTMDDPQAEEIDRLALGVAEPKAATNGRRAARSR